MISLTKSVIELHNKDRPIIRWDTWFMTPYGVSTNLEDAIKRCIEADLDPELAIMPTPVAIAQDTYEIFFPRR